MNQNDWAEDSSAFYGTESIPRLFAKVVVPSVLAMIVAGSQSIIDGLFLGNFVGDSAMASANIAFPFFQLIAGISTVISIGANAFLGRSLGAGNLHKAKNIFQTAFRGILGSAVVLICMGYFGNMWLAHLLGANEVLVEGSAAYIRTLALCSPFMLLYYLFSFTNRMVGFPHLLMISTVVNILSNICLNYLLIVVFQKGMVGAATATGASFALGLLINIVPLCKKTTIVNVQEGTFRWNILGTIVYNGSSEGITALASGFTVYLFNRTFMDLYGESGVTAFTIINYISQITVIMMFGVADGVSPMLSYNYGAQLLERVKKIMWTAGIFNILLGLLAYSVVFFWGEGLIASFEPDNAEVVAMASHGAKIFSLFFLLCGNNILLSAYFTSIGNAISSGIASLARGLVFIIVGILVLPRLFPKDGIWMVVPYAELMALFVGQMLLYEEKRKRRRKISF